MMVNWNGAMVPLEEARIPVFDHAYLYGDGVFEGIRIYNGRIFKLDEHLNRLFDGMQHLQIDEPVSYLDVKQRVIDTMQAAEAMNGYIRISVSRGTGIGLDPRKIRQEANLMIAVTELSLYPKEMHERGLDVVTVSMRVMSPDALDPRIKSIGRYVSNIQAKMEANRQGAGEGLMLNAQGYVAEATGDNLFIVRDGVILTPLPACGILSGITRATAIEIARSLGIDLQETWLTLHDVYAADEAFLTGTAAEIIPMITLDRRTIGDGKPGRVSKRIIESFRELTHQSGLLADAVLT
jgi:branched-chain amino acid aminotransferase